MSLIVPPPGMSLVAHVVSGTILAASVTSDRCYILVLVDTCDL